MAQPPMPATILNVSDESWLTKMWLLASSRYVCIYRVHKSIVLCKREAYTPFVVAFGPYHHANPEFSRMNSYKVEAVSRMLERIETDVITLISRIHKFDLKIRECYEEPIDLDGKELSLLLTMDACFILEFLRGDDPNYLSLFFQPGSCMHAAIFRDIVKLENQIPLFILIAVLELGFHENAKQALVKLLTSWWISCGFPFSNDNASTLELIKGKIERYPPPCHLLDLSRIVSKDLLTNTSGELRISTDRQDTAMSGNKNEGCCWTMKCSSNEWSTPSANSLSQAGITFKPGKLGFEKNVLGKSILSLPQINLEDNTETVLRNLMAYEECRNSKERAIITQVAILMKHLITSERDVSILRKSEVINSLLGSDQDTAHMFNHLGNNHTLCRIPEIEKVKAEVRKHYNRRRNVWREHYSRRRHVWIRELKEKYFATPWSLISFLAALFALFLTGVQTWYAFKQGTK